MRLSSLVIAAVLLCSLALYGQHSSGGGGGSSSGGGHSGGGFSGGSSGGGSHSGSFGGSHGSGSVSSSSGHGGSSGAGSAHSSSERTASGHTSSAQISSERISSERGVRDPERTGLNIRPSLLKPPVTEKVEERPEKKGIFSFLHHKNPAPKRANFISPRPRCRPGQKCFIRPTGCQTTLAWNASYCGGFYDQYYWFNACQSLADQLARQWEQMRITNDAGASLRYQMLENQYRQCMMRNGLTPFSSYLFMSDLEYP